MADPTIDLSIPMATAVPVTTTPIKGNTTTIPLVECNDSPVLRQDQIAQLQAQGFPQGLATELGRTRSVYPLRFWVVDNSGAYTLCIARACVEKESFVCRVAPPCFIGSHNTLLSATG